MSGSLPIRLDLNFKVSASDTTGHLPLVGPGRAPLAQVSNISISSGFSFPDKVRGPAAPSNPTHVNSSPVGGANKTTVHRVAVNATNSFSGNPNVRVGSGGSVSLNTPSLNINHALVEALLTGQKIGNGLTKIASAIGVTPLGWTAPGIAVRAAGVGIGVALYEAGTWGLNQLMNGTHQRIAGPFQKPGPIIETVPMDQPKIEPLKGRPINDSTLPDDMDIEGYNTVDPKWLDSYEGRGDGSAVNYEAMKLPGTTSIDTKDPRQFIHLSEQFSDRSLTRDAQRLLEDVHGRRWVTHGKLDHALRGSLGTMADLLNKGFSDAERTTFVRRLPEELKSGLLEIYSNHGENGLRKGTAIEDYQTHRAAFEAAAPELVEELAPAWNHIENVLNESVLYEVFTNMPDRWLNEFTSEMVNQGYTFHKPLFTDTKEGVTTLEAHSRMMSSSNLVSDQQMAFEAVHYLDALAENIGTQLRSAPGNSALDLELRTAIAKRDALLSSYFPDGL